jgi:hypothetical protein
MLMVVDSDGIVVAHELVMIETSMIDMWSGMFARLMDTFINLGARPTQLTVRPGPLAVVAQALSEILGFQLRIDRQTPNLNRAKAGLLRMMARG